LQAGLFISIAYQQQNHELPVIPVGCAMRTRICASAAMVCAHGAPYESRPTKTPLANMAAAFLF
jgi:hypothetical protein